MTLGATAAALPRTLRAIAPVAAVAGLALAHSFAARGPRQSVLFAALGLGGGAVVEYVGIHVTQVVRHHSRPQILGVPIAAVLSWYAIMYGSFATVERRTPRSWARALSAAAVATSLDLVLDAFGLERGFWEWNVRGQYALDVRGPNGRRGIPWGNFAVWFALTASISRLFLLFSPADAPRRIRPRVPKWGALLLLPYYVPSAVWALRTRRVRLLAYSALVPIAILRTARGTT